MSNCESQKPEATKDNVSTNSIDEGLPRELSQLSLSTGSNSDEFHCNKGHSESTMKNICGYYQAQKLCDVVLIAGGCRIPAHKVVLASCSEYFAAMFTGSLKEAQSSEITLERVDSQILRSLVHYCYTGNIELTEDTVEILLSTASLLQLHSITKACCDFLEKQLDPCNCLGIAYFAEQQSCMSLHKSALDYTHQNYMQVIKHQEFLTLQAEQLANLLKSDDLNVETEETVFESLMIWVKHDNTNRDKHLADLLKLVKLPLLSSEYLIDKVEQVCGDVPECQPLIMEAVKWHLLPERRSLLFSHRTRPRTSTIGRLLAIGGMDGYKGASNMEMYDPRTNSWTPFMRMGARRLQFGVAVLQNKLVVVGGRDGLKTLNTVECFDLTSLSWSTLAPMNTHRHGLGVAVLGNGPNSPIYAVGGHDGWIYLNSVESMLVKSSGPYAADKAAFSLLVKLEKLKIKVPYERHFLLLCLCTSVLVKIRYYAEYLFSKCATDWEKIVSFSTPKVLRLGEILELFQPPENVRETNIKNAADEVKVSDCSIVDENDNKNKSTITDNINGDVHILNEKDLHNGMKKSKTNELLKAIEKCDFTTLGNKIEDRVNTYEANLKDLDDFYDLPENNNESSPKLAISVINENKSPKNIINDNTNTEIDSKNDGSSINNSIVNQNSDNIQLNQDSEYNNGDTGNEDIENKGSDNKDSDNKGSDNKDSGNKDSVNKDSGNKDSVNKDSGIKNSGNKEIDKSTESGKLGFGKRAGHRLKGRNRVQRSSTMKMQQSQQNPDSLCGIVFVKEVLMAKVLFMIIADMSRSRPSLSYLCAQYCASEGGREKDCQREGKKQEEVLKKFRMHECNLLLATSVLEEGIDLPRCNLVVRWDVPLSYRSHGLCRSRARAPRASVALLALAESHAGALVHNLAVYKELDQIITRKCGCGIQFEPPLEEENHADSVAFIVKPYTPDIRNDSTHNTKFKETDSNKRNCEEIEERKMGVELLDHKKKVNIDLYNTKPIAVVDGVISDICYEPEINVDKIDNEETSENKINDLKSEDNYCLIGNEVLGENVTQIQIHPMTADVRLSEQEKNVINATEHKDLSTKDFYPNDITENTEMTYNSVISFKINKDKHCDNLTDEDKINRENNKKCANEMTAEILDKDDRVNFDNALQNSDVKDIFDNEIDKLEANSNISFETIDNNILNHNIDAVEDSNDKNLGVNDSLTGKFGANSVYEDIKYDFKLNDSNKSNGNMATVDLNSAIALINRYCGKLPSDTFTRLAPQWWMEEVRLPDKQGTMTTAYICTLRMPLNCPVKYNIVGHPMPTRVLARRMVALQACRILHKSGELDNQLMPIGKENFKAAELEASATCSEPDSSDCARPGTTKRRQYYFKRTAWAFTDCQAIIDSTDQEIENNPSQDTTKASSHNMLYAIVSRLWCALPERYNTRGRRLHAPQHAAQAIGVLMARREPTQLQIPAFPVYTRSGEVRVSVEPALEADVRLSPRRARLIRRFMRFVFADVLLVRRRGMRLQADGTSYNNYYVVPTVKKIKSDGSYWTDVDWLFLELIYRHTEEQKNLEVDMPVLWEQADKKKEKEKDGNVKKMENPLLKDGEVFTFDPEKYKEAVVTPWYRNQDQPQFFLVAEICWKLSPDSAFPSAQHDSFRSYYRAKYGAELTQSLQPLLDVDHTSARLNLLTPRYVNRKGVTLPVSSERTRRAKRDRLDQKQILVPELCRVHPFAAPLWFATVALPCVLYRINALLIADEIRRAVAIDVGLGIPRIDDGTCPGFQWPPLDFGWSLAELKMQTAEWLEDLEARSRAASRRNSGPFSRKGSLKKEPDGKSTPPNSSSSTPKKIQKQQNLDFIVTGKQFQKRGDRASSLPSSSHRRQSVDALLKSKRSLDSTKTPSTHHRSRDVSLEDDMSLDLSQVSDFEDMNMKYGKDKLAPLATSTPKRLGHKGRSSSVQSGAQREPREVKILEQRSRDSIMSSSRDSVYKTSSSGTYSFQSNKHAVSTEMDYSSLSPECSGMSSGDSVAGVAPDTLVSPRSQDLKDSFSMSTWQEGGERGEGEWAHFWANYNNSLAAVPISRYYDQCPTPYRSEDIELADLELSTDGSRKRSPDNIKTINSIIRNEGLRLTPRETQNVIKCAHILGNVLTKAIERQSKTRDFTEKIQELNTEQSDPEKELKKKTMSLDLKETVIPIEVKEEKRWESVPTQTDISLPNTKSAPKIFESILKQLSMSSIEEKKVSEEMKKSGSSQNVNT